MKPNNFWESTTQRMRSFRLGTFYLILGFHMYFILFSHLQIWASEQISRARKEAASSRPWYRIEDRRLAICKNRTPNSDRDTLSMSSLHCGLDDLLFRSYKPNDQSTWVQVFDKICRISFSQTSQAVYFYRRGLHVLARMAHNSYP